MRRPATFLWCCLAGLGPVLGAPGPVLAGGDPPSAGSTRVLAAYGEVETTPVGSTGDAADDMAVWVHPTDPSLSVVIGTDKRAALEVYDLSGRRIQRIAMAEAPNNVDLRFGFPLGGQSVDLVGTAGRGMRFFRVDPAARRLVEVTVRPFPSPFYEEGFCLYRSSVSARFYAFTGAPDGRVAQWELIERAGLVDARRVRAWDVGSAVEGCVADDELGRLYVGEEEVGIWEYGAEPDAQTFVRALVDRTGPGGHLVADVEGLAIVYQPGGRGYLVASSQGDNSFVVYRRRAGHAFLGKLQVGAGRAADGCSDTDGIEAVAAYLGPAFPSGIFVCQDGQNTAPGSFGRQNFKFVGLEQVLGAMGMRG